MVALGSQFAGSDGPAPPAIEMKPYMTKGGQGKFFKDPKPSDEHRYPRGYTPERMHDVQANGPAIVRVRRSVALPGGGSGPGPDQPVNAAQDTRAVRETIARSTTPMSDFGPGRSALIRTNESAEHMELPSGSAAGVYRRPPIDRPQQGGTISLREGNLRTPDAEQTLIHELGHHKSRVVDANKESDYRTPIQRGREEANADDNIVNRWRPDPRDVRAGKDTRPRPGYEGSSFRGLGGMAARASYLKRRQTPNQRVLRGNENAAAAKAAQNLPYEGDLGHGIPGVHRNQGRLFLRDYTDPAYVTQTGKDSYGTISQTSSRWAPNESAIFNDRRE